jgi:transposase
LIISQAGDGEGPSELLKDFRGHLQTDGYAAYNIFHTQKNVTLLHCMAHARRKFVETRANDQARADYVLDKIQQLYAIERKAADEQLSEADILQLMEKRRAKINFFLQRGPKNKSYFTNGLQSAMTSYVIKTT